MGLKWHICGQCLSRMGDYSLLFLLESVSKLFGNLFVKRLHFFGGFVKYSNLVFLEDSRLNIIIPCVPLGVLFYLLHQICRQGWMCFYYLIQVVVSELEQLDWTEGIFLIWQTRCIGYAIITPTTVVCSFSVISFCQTVCRSVTLTFFSTHQSHQPCTSYRSYKCDWIKLSEFLPLLLQAKYLPWVP